MGRKPRSLKPKTEPAQAEAGHNSGGITDQQQEALWFQHRGQLVNLQGQIDALVAKKRNVYKSLKADLGITKTEADYAIGLADDADNKALHSHRRRMMLARWENHPIGTQADMFDDVDRTPGVQKAYNAGKKVGFLGEPCSPPHDPATEQAQRWIAGWQDGQAAKLGKGITPLANGTDGQDVRPRSLQTGGTAPGVNVPLETGDDL
jgi:hypothetical protein